MDGTAAAVGYRPDESLFAPLGGRPAYVCADQTREAVELRGPDRPNGAGLAGRKRRRDGTPGYYLLGAKSYGTNSNFLLRVGHRQVQDVFREILREADDDDPSTVVASAAG